MDAIGKLEGEKLDEGLELMVKRAYLTESCKPLVSSILLLTPHFSKEQVQTTVATELLRRNM
ncbi:hypothetical protein GC105_05835 [Alkalibaculum sp. M08DMB]|uniref:Uncharacterized protein n=1 Tax=Alkalibaculum sporogenes TaxID=2655001 RepID=A0A6A7K881_9FIRM|nr:hypothetical protein [Alkalibaculum sporogenes]MPW25303.1 hypothetical protein [Alkalibaculum sporogenes]